MNDSVAKIAQIIVLIWSIIRHVIKNSYNVKFLINVKPRVESELDLINKNSETKENSPELDRISVNPNRMNGQPCIRDLRMTVSRVIEISQTYPDRAELYREFPELTEEDIKQAIIYAKTHSQDLTVTSSISHETLA
jgi:uncharacterized protein (DUF433 family)